MLPTLKCGQSRFSPWGLLYFQFNSPDLSPWPILTSHCLLNTRPPGNRNLSEHPPVPLPAGRLGPPSRFKISGSIPSTNIQLVFGWGSSWDRIGTRMTRQGKVWLCQMPGVFWGLISSTSSQSLSSSASLLGCHQHQHHHNP